ncbi:NAD-glutamate dehydrogenase [Pseudomarimonas salicorniae]|uniref:NAD-glutamate dehydrogenase n=1 Tax=Pseudomarimonas salicorniae TaxID=2933270 RepID=A0ABT0GJC0_9GAMM|nr:NAD-glutamate dehydrogenase domain-containing protein [Lysobacter sp. CAU 1642]MCK7594654.1 NAD-glutamate dehydrogenase [Lysobacter sp. CAU 1642]
MNAVAASPSNPLDAVIAAVCKRLPAPRHKDATALAEAFCRRVNVDDFGSRSAEQWSSLLCGFLDFLRDRKVDTPKIRIFNPTLEDHGWESSHTVIQIVNDDMPFLVDSVSMAITQNDALVHAMIHPVLHALRDPAGHLLGIDGKGRAESLMHIEIDRQAEAEDLRRFEAAISAALGDVRACVRDWAKMRDRMRDCAEELASRPVPDGNGGRAEAVEFLRWIADDHFTFLGYREYAVEQQDGEDVLRAVDGTGLGLLGAASRGSSSRSVKSLAAHELPQSGAAEALILTKTNARSSVHRPGYMDYIGILRFNEQGEPIAEQRFIGLYTSSAYNRRPWDIPLVRRRFDAVMQRSELPSNSHSGKALRHILESLPRDELFQSTEDELFRTAIGILGLQERARTKLFLRRDRYGRFFSVLVYIPRDRFNTEVRRRIEAMLREALHGERLDTTVQVGESTLAQLHLLIRPKAGHEVEVDTPALEAELAQIVRNWQDELRDQLVAQHGEPRGIKLFSRYGKALPAGYVEQVSPHVAAEDVEQVASLHGPEDLRLKLYRTSRAEHERLRFKLFRYATPLVLSEALPIMENMGVRVLSEHPYEVEVAGESIYIQDFEIMTALEQVGFEAIDVDALRGPFEDAFEQIWRGNAENDGFNRLILNANLDWRQVAMLRGYCKYLLQTGVPFSQPYMEESLARYPLMSRLLVELFEAKFHPATGNESPEEIKAGQAAFRAQLEAVAAQRPVDASVIDALVELRGQDRATQMRSVEDALHQLMDRVQSLDDDRILRSFIAIINATLRTSFYQKPDGQYANYIAFKFDPSKVPDLPKPRPYREIFVYGPRVEGVHLRFGPVARGGLRWSDRREDFRTEVLGLVKAQMVKNTVIVPVGAKGGFFVKRPPISGDRDAVLAEGIACYRMFINGLLDITDNLVEGKVVPPRDVVRHDADDPYLVVAADKGTATFSDIANSISAEHGFWLGDAFASGGSVGYDHKGMGITAKGAWESVKRHFRAMGRDSQSEDFTCVGVGDMSGDVFGNGMLLSKHIRLIAAFDHRHIFIDPNPDSARSFVERERMFKLPRSSWEDYDKSLISAGGGVWPRSAKTITLSAEAKEALGIDPSVGAMSPNELLSAILRAPVDLLWNGGIGTYVKSQDETHADVGDRANNAIRVNGAELRCRVVGEGGNLGMTQKGRIEAAQHGVLLNTDFIDNSAGVDTSDHEVNIKILLNEAVARSEMDVEARNVLLAQMTAEVEQLVLFDNYRQNQAISVMERMSAQRLGSLQHFIRILESRGLLDRALEFLPSDSEFSERKLRGQGLTRPELSILLSYDKIVLYQQLLESEVPEDPFLSKELARYFPEPLRERFKQHMEGHRLRREIIATAVTNSLVNRMGATFMLRMQEDTGESPAEIAKAYTIAREVLDARTAWSEIDALDGKVTEAAQIDALMLIWSVLRAQTRWLLQKPGRRGDIAAEVARYLPGMIEMRAMLGKTLGGEDLEQFKSERQRWCEAGFPQNLAERLALLPFLGQALHIIEVALEHERSVLDVARVHSDLGQSLHTHWLLQRIEELPVEGRWHALARGALRDELQAQQGALVAQLLGIGKVSADKVVAKWTARDDQALRFTLQMFAEIRSQRSTDYPTVQVAVRRLAQLAAASAR